MYLPNKTGRANNNALIFHIHIWLTQELSHLVTSENQKKSSQNDKLHI